MNEETRSCNLVVDSDSEEISISGLTSEDLTIEYGSDIDLTDLVISFAKLIDTGETVSLEMPSDVGDDKISLVLATITDVADSYNSSLETSQAESAEESEPADDSDIPF